MLMRMPGAPRQWRIFVDVTDRARADQLPEATLATLQALLDERGMGAGHMRIRAVYWTSTYRTNLRLAPTIVLNACF